MTEDNPVRQTTASIDQEEQSFSAQPTRSFWRELVDTVFPAIAIALIIYLFLARTYGVQGQSMEPNLHDHQRLIVDLVSYRLRIPHRGEIVVFDVPEPISDIPLIKRVVGIPGDTVEVKGGAVYVNGRRLDEPYLAEQTLGQMALRTVPEGHAFVLGDNRNYANDSRAFGMVPLEDIVGRAWIRYWPPADVGVLELPLATFSGQPFSQTR
jgi:signal peptidase I